MNIYIDILNDIISKQIWFNNNSFYYDIQINNLKKVKIMKRMFLNRLVNNNVLLFVTYLKYIHSE